MGYEQLMLTGDDFDSLLIKIRNHDNFTVNNIVKLPTGEYRATLSLEVDNRSAFEWLYDNLSDLANEAIDAGDGFIYADRVFDLIEDARKRHEAEPMTGCATTLQQKHDQMYGDFAATAFSLKTAIAALEAIAGERIDYVLDWGLEPDEVDTEDAWRAVASNGKHIARHALAKVNGGNA